MWAFDVSTFCCEARYQDINDTSGKCVIIYWQEEPSDQQAGRTEASFYNLYVCTLGFPTMLLATGRRPPSVSKGRNVAPSVGVTVGMEGRESRTREHGRGEGRERRGLHGGQQSFS